MGEKEAAAAVQARIREATAVLAARLDAYDRALMAARSELLQVADRLDRVLRGEAE